MANVGCRIRKEFERPDRKLVEAFKDIPVANIDDCMNRIGAVSYTHLGRDNGGPDSH